MLCLDGEDEDEMKGNVQMVRGWAWFDPTIMRSKGEALNHSTIGSRVWSIELENSQYVHYNIRE